MRITRSRRRSTTLPRLRETPRTPSEDHQLPITIKLLRESRLLKRLSSPTSMDSTLMLRSKRSWIKRFFQRESSKTSFPKEILIKLSTQHSSSTREKDLQPRGLSRLRDLASQLLLLTLRHQLKDKHQFNIRLHQSSNL